MKELKDKRKQLGNLDRRILELIARRQHLAAEIGQIKIRQGQTTRDFTQEKEVIERARRTAGELGLPGSLAERVLQLLIQNSLAQQEQQRVIHQAGGSGKRVLIIGGAGRMGRWFARFLASQGFEVQIADPAGPMEEFSSIEDWRTVPLDHDYVVVATPIRETRSILADLKACSPPGVVFDISSLKSPLRNELRALVEAGIRVTSVHPMFGPDTRLLSNRHVILVDVGVAEATEAAERLFQSTMAGIVRMSLEDHDRLIAYVLGLSHALNISFFTALAESGEGAARLAEMSSTTFNAQLSVAASVAEENPHLYFEIQSLNDYGTESLAALLYAIEKLRSVVRSGDEEAFVALMDQGRRYLNRRLKKLPSS
ncbi:MAG TPA: bifunctional chorismate mutase/prephenate dehydrogenase [Acidobacteriota bacterium]|nr:bifunctional chorismate mutase/prephenate dehydrogenase [Acidobacteriota bacterium]